MVFDFFDSIFCITTDASSPRARLAEAQFIELGIKAEFVQGEVTTPITTAALGLTGSV
jgi:hypothetical protein